MLLKRQLFCILILLLPISAFASMSIDRSIIFFSADQEQRQDVVVSNPDKENLYIEVEVLQVLNPGMDNEERVVVKNPKQAGFIVTPSKMVIAPGKKKLVRMLNLTKNPQTDSVFRINLKPITPPLAEKQTGVKVVVGYQLLAIVQPKNAAPNLQVKRENNKLFFTNTGNTHVLLRAGVQCPENVEFDATQDQAECKQLPSRRLYAGNSWQLELPFNTAVNYSLATGMQNSQAVY